LLNLDIYSGLVIALAVVFANLPFINHRLFAIIPLPLRLIPKPAWFRLLELALCYVIVGAIGMTFEAKIGTVFSQAWGFYAVTACLFIVLAFPGFAFCYLRRRHD
jgi:hypothetical protein